MIDILQYWIIEYIKKKRFLKDKPKNKHFKNAHEIVMSEIEDLKFKSKLFERVSYDETRVWNGNDKIKCVSVVVKNENIKKILDKDGNVIWEKSVEL